MVLLPDAAGPSMAMVDATLVVDTVNLLFPLSLATFQIAHFARAQLAPFTDRQRAQFDRTDAHADQPVHRVPDRAAQVADLAFLALVQNNPQPGLPVPRVAPMLSPRRLAQLTNNLCGIGAQ